MGKGLVILHLDGVGHDFLIRSLAQGRMPAVARLIAEEGYQVQPYRCGIPSTTPFCQAGILYGDNSEIPSFRWWDKEAGILVAFGAHSSFKKVAHRYFRGRKPLTEGGAVIGACFPAGASDTFGLAYRERDFSGSSRSSSALEVVLPYFASPARVADWLRHGGWAVARTSAMVARARLRGLRPAPAYVFSDLLEEIFLHHVACFAVERAMDQDFPIIYAGFYAYDETAHGFGPEDDYTFEMLEHIDETVGRIAAHRAGRAGRATGYELVLLSDHGQVETEPFNQADGRTLGELVSAMLPSYEVREYKGKRHRPKGDALDGHVALAYSGGLAHLYFTDLPGRLEAVELDRRFPGLLEKIASLGRVAFVLVAGPEGGHLVRGASRMPIHGQEAARLLAHYDDGQAATRDLARLNSFQRSGDVIVFAETRQGRQLNFEHQVGGHGSIGGEQVKPFLMARSEWGLDLSGVRGAADLHALLSGLRDRLAAGPG